jgi:hypothetical protein
MRIRRAQNRYREKQKVKMAAVENEYVDTAAELDRARLENLRLREQQTTMQQVLSVRDSAMAILQTGKVSRAWWAAGIILGVVATDGCCGNVGRKGRGEGRGARPRVQGPRGTRALGR